MLLAYTIVSNNYLAHALSLAESFVRHHPDAPFVVALADEPTPTALALPTGCTIVPVGEMAIEELAEMSARYNIFELSCALKPFVARYLFEKHVDAVQIFYFDSDMLVFDRMDELLAAEAQIMLTPHFFSHPDWPDLPENGVLRSGIFNAGFFGLRRGAESQRFLHWWAAKLRHQCFDRQWEGLFVDQLWLNLVMVYFPASLLIIPQRRYNVAYWNLHERMLSLRQDRFWVNDEGPLAFYHFSGYSLAQPELISRHQLRYQFANMPMLRPLYEAYVAGIQAHGYEQVRALAPALGKKPTPKKKWWQKLLGQ